MICGGLNAYVYCLYYVVTVTGKQIFLLLGYGAGLIFAVFLGSGFVKSLGMLGAALSCTLSFGVVFIVFLIITSCVVKDRKKKTEV